MITKSQELAGQEASIRDDILAIKTHLALIEARQASTGDKPHPEWMAKLRATVLRKQAECAKLVQAQKDERLKQRTERSRMMIAESTANSIRKQEGRERGEAEQRDFQRIFKTVIKEMVPASLYTEAMQETARRALAAERATPVPIVQSIRIEQSADCLAEIDRQVAAGEIPF